MTHQKKCNDMDELEYWKHKKSFRKGSYRFWCFPIEFWYNCLGQVSFVHAKILKDNLEMFGLIWLPLMVVEYVIKNSPFQSTNIHDVRWSKVAWILCKLICNSLNSLPITIACSLPGLWCIHVHLRCIRMQCKSKLSWRFFPVQ